MSERLHESDDWRQHDYDGCMCDERDCPDCGLDCDECDGDGWVFGGEGLFYDDPERFGENETYNCPNCGGSGRREDMTIL